MALGPIFGVLFDGFAYGMLLFLLSVGLSVTLGMMNFINLAHCAFAMFGGYVTVTLTNRFGWPFLAALPLAFLSTAAVSVLFERILYRRLYKAAELDQVLLTIGLAFMSVAGAAFFFGTVQQPVETPSFLRGSFSVLGVSLGAYRLFLIAVGLAIMLLLTLMLEYTRFGAQVRAAVDNERMASGLGINVEFGICYYVRAWQWIGRTWRCACDRDRGARSFVRTCVSRLRFDRCLCRRARIHRRVVRRRSPPWHQRYVRQVLFPRAWRLPHLRCHDRHSDVAACRLVREALTNGGHVKGGCRSACVSRSSDPLAADRVRVLGCDARSVLAVSELPFPRQSDCHHCTVRVVARFDSWLCRHRFAGARGLFRPGGVHSGYPIHLRLGRPIAGLGGGGRGCRPARLCHELHHRPLPAPGPDYDYTRPGATGARGRQQGKLADRRFGRAPRR